VSAWEEYHRRRIEGLGGRIEFDGNTVRIRWRGAEGKTRCWEGECANLNDLYRAVDEWEPPR